MEKLIKFLFKVCLVMFSLMGIRYLLSFINIIIPYEWFIIMGCGMCGFYGIFLLLIYVFL